MSGVTPNGAPPTGPGRSSKGLWWGAVAVLALVVVAFAYFGTRSSQRADARREAAGAVGGVAYSDTRGRPVPADAKPGAGDVPTTASGRQASTAAAADAPR